MGTFSNNKLKKKKKVWCWAPFKKETMAPLLFANDLFIVSQFLVLLLLLYYEFLSLLPLFWIPC